MSDNALKEFEAIKVIHDSLLPIGEDGRVRVLTYIISLLGINANIIDTHTLGISDKNNSNDDLDNNEPLNEIIQEKSTFSGFAELYASANPKTNGDKSLLAGYWLQVCQHGENFTAAAANKELTNLGHKIANITDAIDSMKNQKPMLILQVKKSGNSKQARKLYKVSHEGIKAVEEMLRG